MFRSPEDFALICQLMLSKGKLGTERILSPATVEMMTSSRLDDYPELPESIRRSQPWGLGWRMNHPGTPGSWSDLLDRSVFGHTGATGTMCWIDPRREGFCLIFTSGIRSRAPWRLVQVSNAVAASFVWFARFLRRVLMALMLVRLFWTFGWLIVVERDPEKPRGWLPRTTLL